MTEKQSKTPIEPRIVQASDLTWSDTLRDGTAILVRPIRPSDAESERHFIEALSPESRRFRFLGDVKTPSDALLDQFTRIDPAHEMAFVAMVDEGENEVEIGVSRYEAGLDGKSCECAVVVMDAWQNRGVATLLMRHLMDVARAHGIERMYSIDSSANSAMHELATHLGFEREADPDDETQVIHRIDLQAGSRPAGANASAPPLSRQPQHSGLTAESPINPNGNPMKTRPQLPGGHGSSTLATVETTSTLEELQNALSSGKQPCRFEWVRCEVAPGAVPLYDLHVESADSTVALCTGRSLLGELTDAADRGILTRFRIVHGADLLLHHTWDGSGPDPAPRGSAGCDETSRAAQPDIATGTPPGLRR